MKQSAIIFIIVAVIAVAGGAWAYNNYFVGTRVTEEANQPTAQEPAVADNTDTTEDTEEPTEMEALADGTYEVSVEESSMDWEGRKTLIADYVDMGSINLEEGALTVEEGVVTGEIIVDMDSIAAASTGKKSGEELLTNHLKSEDFFDVENHPTTTFTITETIPAEDVETSYMHTVKGDMTIKGITEEIEFPAKIYMQNGKLMAEAEATLDRTKWDIRFGSDSFFDNLGDNVIDDNFTVTFNLVATN